IVSALAGTAVGIVVGALLVIGIGTHEAVLWGVLPIAILLAAYAPRAISFAAGQAAFSVVLFVLFNIIQPVGWRVGLIRFEGVARPPRGSVARVPRTHGGRRHPTRPLRREPRRRAACAAGVVRLARLCRREPAHGLAAAHP